MIQTLPIVYLLWYNDIWRDFLFTQKLQLLKGEKQHEEQEKGITAYYCYFSSNCTVFFTTLVGFTKAHKGSARNIKLGLDLAGGVSITYDVVGDKPTDAELKDTVTMMQKRAEVHSTESSVVTDEKGRIVIDIPVLMMQRKYCQI